MFHVAEILHISNDVYIVVDKWLFYLNVVLWYLQTCIIDLCSLTIPEPESVESQIGIFGGMLLGA